MSKEYEVGYKKPPRHTQFKPGNRCNPRGRGKATAETPADIMRRVLNEPAEYRMGAKVKRAPQIELLVRKICTRACKGDVKAAGDLLKIRAHCHKLGDVNPKIDYFVISETEARF